MKPSGRMRRTAVRTVLGALLALVAAAAPAQARSGSITDVHAVAGGEVAATFSATSTECTTYGFCGWFPEAWQVAADAPCTAGGRIAYVGDYQDAAGTQTAVDTFLPAFDPVKLCLYVYFDAAYQPVAETTYSAPVPTTPPPVTGPARAPAATAPAGPALLDPAPDVRLTAAPSIAFHVRSPDPGDWVWVEVSRSNALDADGTLTDDRVLDSDYSTVGTVRLSGGWTERPGTYYWQASRFACGPNPRDCQAESEVRKLEIVPPPLALTFGAKARQKLRRPALLDRFNNLIVRLRCNRACSVHLEGRPSFRQGGRWQPLRGLALFEDLALRGGQGDVYGVRFGAADRERLIAAMRAHGPLRWKLAVRAVTDDGDVERAVRFIRMTPPPLPAPPRPAPAPAPAPQPSPGPSCDPSYGVCIPPPPPDLDCSEVPYSDFPVHGSDPHGFDGDGDGVGCES